MKSFIIATLAAGLLAGSGTQALAADSASVSMPGAVVHLIVGYPAGTSPDIVARVIAEPLGQALGKTVVVENKPGAAGNLGVDAVVKSTDGATFGITTNGPLTTSKALFAKLPYDPAKDVKPLSLAATSPLVLVSGLDVPVATMGEFLAYARKQPEGVTYGSIGIGSGSHLTMELFASEASLKMVHVPYQGFPQVTTAIIAGQIQSGFMAPSGALAQARAHKVRLLGVSSSERSELVPDVPTIAEGARLPGFRAELWIAAFGPASMPQGVADQLTAQINRILASPEVKHKLLQQGWQAVAGSPDTLRARIEQDTAIYGKVIARAGIHPE